MIQQFLQVQLGMHNCQVWNR